MQGITFEQYSDFCQLLNNLDDFGITLTIFTMADTPVTPGKLEYFIREYFITISMTIILSE